MKTQLSQKKLLDYPKVMSQTSQVQKWRLDSWQLLLRQLRSQTEHWSFLNLVSRLNFNDSDEPIRFTEVSVAILNVHRLWVTGLVEWVYARTFTANPFFCELREPRQRSGVRSVSAHDCWRYADTRARQRSRRRRFWGSCTCRYIKHTCRRTTLLGRQFFKGDSLHP